MDNNEKITRIIRLLNDHGEDLKDPEIANFRFDSPGDGELNGLISFLEGLKN